MATSLPFNTPQGEGMFQPDLLRGKRVLITGGGTGLGAAMAGRFSELGASLVLCGRRAQVLEETASRLRAGGADVATHACDVRHPDTVEQMFAEVCLAQLVVELVNNAHTNFSTVID